MTRLMFDSTAAADIPAGSALVMGYVDGSTAWTADDFARFPDRKVVRICIFSDRTDAQVIDLEPHNNDAKGALPWVAAKWAKGETPTVYCFSDAGPEGYRISDVRAACDAAGIRHPLFLITKDDGDAASFDPAGDPEIIGKQYANSDRTGAHYDESIVADFWPGVDGERPAPTSPAVYVGQSADLTGTAALAIGHVGQLAAAWDYGHGPRWQVVKVVRHRPGRCMIVLYPPVDPDADPTLDLCAQPALWVVDVTP